MPRWNKYTELSRSPEQRCVSGYSSPRFLSLASINKLITYPIYKRHVPYINSKDVTYVQAARVHLGGDVADCQHWNICNGFLYKQIPNPTWRDSQHVFTDPSTQREQNGSWNKNSVNKTTIHTLPVVYVQVIVVAVPVFLVEVRRGKVFGAPSAPVEIAHIPVVEAELVFVNGDDIPLQVLDGRVEKRVQL